MSCAPVVGGAESPSLTFAGSEAATIGVDVVDLSTGRHVAELNAGMAMTPASILKCVTTAAALTRLGPDFRFETPVYLRGTLSGGTLHGDVVIKGGGDPTLDDGHFAEQPGFVTSLVNALSQKDITTITGDIVIDDGDLPDQGQSPQWLIEDTAWDYGAGFYSFNYASNTYTLNVSTMSTSPEVPLPEVITRRADESTDMLRGVNSDLLLLTGRNVANRGYTVTTTMDCPADAALTAVENALKSAGITVTGDEEAGAEAGESLLMVYRSPKASDILDYMMVHSDNLMAEGMLRALAPGCSRSRALAAERAVLADAGISLSHAKLVDGSGLARVDRVTPRLMSEVLAWMASGENASLYTSFFPVVGREGTVKRLLKGTRLEGKLVLKSGSMNGIHCYAGYRLDDDGVPSHSVVIIVNNFFCSRNDVRDAIQRLLLRLF